MAKWTPKRRQQQSKAIHGWKPWNRSTGPRTPAGKARVSRNALKHGQTTARALAERAGIRALLNAAHELIAAC